LFENPRHSYTQELLGLMPKLEKLSVQEIAREANT